MQVFPRWQPRRDRQRRRHRPHLGRLSGRCIFILTGHSEDVTSAIFPQTAAECSPRDATKAIIWDAATGRTHLNIFDAEDGLRTAAYSADGLRVVTTTTNRIARVWDAISGRALYVLKGHTQDLRGAVFSPDMARVATASSDGNVRVWDVRSGRYGQIFQSKFELNSAMFSPDGGRVVTTHIDHNALLWNAKSERSQRCSPATPPRSTGVPFPQTASASPPRRATRRSKLWDGMTGRPVGTISGHQARSSKSPMPPTEHGFARPAPIARQSYGTPNSSACIDAVGHTSEVRSCSFSPDGSRLVTASSDGNAGSGI